MSRVRGLVIDLLAGFLRTCSLTAEAEFAQLEPFAQPDANSKIKTKRLAA